MKRNFIKGIALGVMFALGSVAVAQEVAPAKVTVNPYLNTDYSVLSVANPTEKTAKFVITDGSGAVVHKEWLSNKAFSQKILDFSGLNDGRYTAKISVKGEEIASQKFAVANHQVSDERIMSKEELKAFFRLNDNILYVSHIAFGANTFGISIEDAIGDQVFEKGFDGNSTYSGKFDISALPDGSYSVKINSGSKEYSYAFTK